MDKVFISLKRAPQKWVIDRFEETWAVLENSETYQVISLPIASLPKAIRPGDTLIKQGTKWYKDDAETAAREKRINERFARIKSKL